MVLSDVILNWELWYSNIQVTSFQRLFSLKSTKDHNQLETVLCVMHAIQSN